MVVHLEILVVVVGNLLGLCELACETSRRAVGEAVEEVLSVCSQFAPRELKGGCRRRFGAGVGSAVCDRFARAVKVRAARACDPVNVGGHASCACL